MYNIREAAARSGVGVPTLRAWERRYGVVQPTRSPGGYRLYAESDIRRVRDMRALIADGWRAREAAQRVMAQAVAAADDASPTLADLEPGPAAMLIADLALATASFDMHGLAAALDEAFARTSFERAMEDVIFPALRQIGEGWQRGQISVAAEHAASQQMHRRIGQFFEATDVQQRPAVVVGTPAGARHELGALAFAVALQRRGIGVLYLGNDVPVQSWLDAVGRSRARVVVVVATVADDVEAAVEVITALGRGAPSVVPLLAGPAADRAAGRHGLAVAPASIAEAAAFVGTLVEAGRR